MQKNWFSVAFHRERRGRGEKLGSHLQPPSAALPVRHQPRHLVVPPSAEKKRERKRERKREERGEEELGVAAGRPPSVLVGVEPSRPLSHRVSFLSPCMAPF